MIQFLYERSGFVIPENDTAGESSLSGERSDAESVEARLWELTN